MLEKGTPESFNKFAFRLQLLLRNCFGDSVGSQDTALRAVALIGESFSYQVEWDSLRSYTAKLNREEIMMEFRSSYQETIEKIDADPASSVSAASDVSFQELKATLSSVELRS